MSTTKNIAWQTGSGNIILTYQGQGNGTITVTSDDNDGAARSQVITVETLDGTKSVNLTVRQTACPVPIGTVLNYAYTGSYQEVELPAGQYKLQCWGAQGGSNGTNSTYGITAKAGGNGGYSEGVITLTQKTTLRVYVGGQGSASAGGYNGGGSTTGTSQYNSGTTFGYSKMGGGGGATDIRLSDGALLSRMIVAGGGSGGAMCYKAVTSSSSSWSTIFSSSGTIYYESGYSKWAQEYDINNAFVSGKQYKVSLSGSGVNTFATLMVSYYNSSWVKQGTVNIQNNTSFTWDKPYSNVVIVALPSFSGIDTTLSIGHHANYTLASVGEYYTNDFNQVNYKDNIDSALEILPGHAWPAYDLDGGERFLCEGSYYLWNGSKLVPMSVSFTVQEYKTTSTTTTSTDYQTGYAGGGSTGGGYSSAYQGKQTGAGSGGEFGFGANQTISNYRYCAPCGGGGWYGGGGGSYSDDSMTYCKYSGGGSGFVNTASSASYRPSGYTGLQLDSGTTYAGSSSFPSTGGGTETGHSGNGYARITRLA